MPPITQDRYRVAIIGSLGRMYPYGVHEDRAEAERIRASVFDQQSHSPFISDASTTSWIEREVDGEWVRE